MYSTTELFEILRLNLSGNLSDREYLAKIKETHTHNVKDISRLQNLNNELQQSNKRLSDRIQNLINENKELNETIKTNKISRKAPVEESKTWKFFNSF
jgi:gas vesicle protein